LWAISDKTMILISPLRRRRDKFWQSGGEKSRKTLLVVVIVGEKRKINKKNA